MKKCKCGCKGIVTSSPYQRRAGKKIIPKFLPGHYSKWASKQGIPGGNKYTPKPSEIPSGICECGCGGKTNLAKVTLRKKRHFVGYPVPFMHSHENRRLGSSSPSWKGGKIFNRCYVLIHSPNHPRKDSKDYVPEHRLVMEEKLGRFLTSKEHVHHINGEPADNRIENLVVLTKGEHSKIHNTAANMRKYLTKSQQRAGGRKGAAARWKGHKKK